MVLSSAADAVTPPAVNSAQIAATQISREPASLVSDGSLRTHSINVRTLRWVSLMQLIRNNSHETVPVSSCCKSFANETGARRRLNLPSRSTGYLVVATMTEATVVTDHSLNDDQIHDPRAGTQRDVASVGRRASADPSESASLSGTYCQTTSLKASSIRLAPV